LFLWLIFILFTLCAITFFFKTMAHWIWTVVNCRRDSCIIFWQLHFITKRLYLKMVYSNNANSMLFFYYALVNFFYWLFSHNSDEVSSRAQKIFGNKSRKRPKYGGVFSFNHKIEFIYIETATTSNLGKKNHDLLKLHEAVVLMFKFIVEMLPEEMTNEISQLPILCIWFCDV